MASVGSHPALEEFDVQNMNCSLNSEPLLKTLHESLLNMAQQPSNLRQIIISQNANRALTAVDQLIHTKAKLLADLKEKLPHIKHLKL